MKYRNLTDDVSRGCEDRVINVADQQKWKRTEEKDISMTLFVVMQRIRNGTCVLRMKVPIETRETRADDIQHTRVYSYALHSLQLLVRDR